MPERRISELDSLRGIAAIGVMLYHYTVRFSEKFDTSIISKHIQFDYGKYGVELFFVISGFVIYMSVKKLDNPRDFLKKRFKRLYPTFWICLIISFVVVSIWGPQSLKVNLKDFILNFTMVPSLFGARSVDGVYWTLKVELFFYCVMLFLIMLRWLDRARIIGYVYIFIGFVTVVVKQSLENPLTNTISLYYYYGLLFLCGINFYNIFKSGVKSWNFVHIFLACVLTAFIDLDYILVFLTIMGIFFLLVNHKLQFLSKDPLLFLGRISYPLYLIHQNIGYSIELNLISIGIENYIVLLATPMLVSILASWVISDYIDQKLTSVISKATKTKYLLH